jgi:hypothetical protein
MDSDISLITNLGFKAVLSDFKYVDVDLFHFAKTVSILAEKATNSG